MRTKMTSVLLGGSLVLGATWAAAQPMGVPQGRWWERPRIAEKLALTAEQKARLESIAMTSAKTMIDLKAEVEKAELDLKGAADTEPLAAARIREAFKVLQQARSRLETERFEMLLKDREVLTTEQWHQLQELKRDRERQRAEGGSDGAPDEGSRPVRPRRY
jgi:Spy/CpxP family protein refolding chaperone